MGLPLACTVLDRTIILIIATMERLFREEFDSHSGGVDTGSESRDNSRDYEMSGLIGRDLERCANEDEALDGS